MIAATPDAFQLMMEGSQALTDVEESGIRVDTDYLNEAIEWSGGRIAELSDELRNDEVFGHWQRVFGAEADFGKREQLATVLFEHMGFECRLRNDKKSDKYPEGSPRTDAEAFEHIDLPFLGKWDNLEKLKRLRSSDLIGTRRELDEFGFLHPHFHLHFLITYRSCSRDPNFQNYPSRDPRQAKIVRRMFVPRENHVIIEADYGALEFRGAACFWKDPAMIAYASDPTLDIHRDIAMECYKLTKDQVAKSLRGNAKTYFVFPTLYGSYYKNTGKNLWHQGRGLTLPDGTDLKDHLASKGLDTLDRFVAHIQQVEQNFHERFPHWSQARDRWWQEYLKNGGFPLMSGFVCRGIYKYSDTMNYPIQGPSFHALLWSLIRQNLWQRTNRMRSRVIGQIHDSILIDAHRDELQDVLNNLNRVMTLDVRDHYKWIVTPLEVEVEVGETSWWDKKEWTRDGSGLWRLAA